ncbi:hypothetical protein ACNOYE_37440 [Nannocystaceae bacterium ST9]
MSINLEFVATVGKWPEEREAEVLAALKAWAYVDEHFDRRDVVVDILGGGPRNPVVRMEAYTTTAIVIAGFHVWSGDAESRLYKRVEAAGGSEIKLEFKFPDDA